MNILNMILLLQFYLSEAAERALGPVIAQIRHLSDLGFKTFEK